MDRIIHITSKVFNSIFTAAYDSSAPIRRVIFTITNQPYLLIGVSLLIIGFAVGIIKRLIRS